MTEESERLPSLAIGKSQFLLASLPDFIWRTQYEHRSAQKFVDALKELAWIKARGATLMN